MVCGFLLHAGRRPNPAKNTRGLLAYSSASSSISREPFSFFTTNKGRSCNCGEKLIVRNDFITARRHDRSGRSVRSDRRWVWPREKESGEHERGAHTRARERPPDAPSSACAGRRPRARNPPCDLTPSRRERLPPATLRSCPPDHSCWARMDRSLFRSSARARVRRDSTALGEMPSVSAIDRTSRPQRYFASSSSRSSGSSAARPVVDCALQPILFSGFRARVPHVSRVGPATAQHLPKAPLPPPAIAQRCTRHDLQPCQEHRLQFARARVARNAQIRLLQRLARKIVIAVRGGEQLPKNPRPRSRGEIAPKPDRHLAQVLS